jgi:hypothetical protein
MDIDPGERVVATSSRFLLEGLLDVPPRQAVACFSHSCFSGDFPLSFRLWSWLTSTEKQAARRGQVKHENVPAELSGLYVLSWASGAVK